MPVRRRRTNSNYGMSKTKAAYLPYGTALPAGYAIDRTACPEGCKACKEACEYGAIDLEQKAERKTFRVAAVVAATGGRRMRWRGRTGLRQVSKRGDERGDGAHGGGRRPTGGRIRRPPTAKSRRQCAFVQCAGSRDETIFQTARRVLRGFSQASLLYPRSLPPS